jgi:threonine dehydratase
MDQHPVGGHDALTLTLDDVRRAAARIAGVAHRTPVLTSRTLDELTGARIFLKAENLQRVGAFKFRGAYNRIAGLSGDERAVGVVASSSGNHAQAVALAAQLCGSSATILMPTDAPASKRAATLGYGATVVDFDRYEDDREVLLRELALNKGLAVVHPYDDPFVMAGAGTTALELVEEVGELDVLVVCLGGGGLLAGCSVAAKGLLPSVRVVGVEPDASPDWQRSIAAGERVHVPVGRTIADGQQLDIPGRLTWPVVSQLVDQVVTVDDATLARTMKLLFERLRIVVEPSGASALAGVLAGKIDVAGLRVGVTVSGGNVDVQRFTTIMSELAG